MAAKAVTKQAIERNISRKRNTSSFGRNAPKLLPVDGKIANTEAAQRRGRAKERGEYKKAGNAKKKKKITVIWRESN